MEEKASKFQLLPIIETIPDGVIITDKNGLIVFANKSAERILGYKRGAVIGKRIDDPIWQVTTLSGEPLPKQDRPYAKVIETRKSILRFEHGYRQPDGTFLFIANSAIPLLDEAGDIEGIVVLMQNITERKLSEEALKESERRFREMLEKVSLLTVIVDAQGRVMFVNDYAVNLTGWQRSELIGKEFDFFIAPDQRELVGRVFVEAITRGEVLPHFEVDVVTRYGERRTISFTNVILRDTQGNPIGTSHIGNDITDRRLAAKEVKESRRQIIDILESITDGFFALDNSWRFTYVNRRAEELIGKKRENILFKNMWEVIPELVGTKFYDEYHAAKETMKPRAFEAFFQRWFEAHVYPYKNGLSAYLSDITEQKEAREALERSERSYRTLFENSPVSLWDEDASSFKNYIDDLRNRGVTDIRSHLEKHPEVLAEYATKVKVVDINRATLELYEAESKDEFKNNLAGIFNEEAYIAFQEALIALAEGKTKFESETVNKTLKGNTIYVMLRIFVPPGYEDTLAKVIVSVTDISKPKQAERSLAESEERYRRLVELSPDPIVLESDEKIVYINLAGVKALSATGPERVIGKPLLDLVRPESIKIAKEQLRQAQRGKAGGLVEEKFIQLDGGLIDVEVAATPISYQGKPATLIVFRDITERKKWAERLRESEERFRAVVEQSVYGIFIGVPGENCLAYNKAMEEIFGYTAEEADRLGWFDIVFPEKQQRDDALKIANRALKGEITYIELPATRKDGRRIWVSFSGMPVTIGGRKFLAGIAADITQRKEEEAELVKMAETFRHVNLGIAIFKNNIIEKANPALAGMLGYSPDELSGRPLPDIFISEDRAGLPEYTRIACEKGHFETDMGGLRRDGQSFPARVEVIAIKSNSGDPRYCIITVQEIGKYIQANSI